MATSSSVTVAEKKPTEKMHLLKYNKISQMTFHSKHCITLAEEWLKSMKTYNISWKLHKSMKNV